MTRNGVSLRLANSPRLCVVGNPENRRVRDFQATAEQLGMGRPDCVSWRKLLEDWPDAFTQLRAAKLVRIDSPGENDDVLHGLIRRGDGRGTLEFGEIGMLREQFHGFRELLRRLSTCRVKFQNSPADIETMFDKWESHCRFVGAGLPRPITRLAPPDTEQFREFRSIFGTPGSGRLFLKPRYASSASGVCAYRWSHDREQLIAPLELRPDGEAVRLYNSLRVRRYTSLPDVTAILGHLLPQDMICERWIRKARLSEGQFDLRVLVIAGEARHTVVRQSHYPMTNLHLGNRRGNLDEVRASVGSHLVDAARRLAEEAAACFPDSLYAGVDIILPAKGEPVICEINAFGDLLPGSTDRGETAYEAILRASLRQPPTFSHESLAQCDR